jgi:pyrroloquinoline-quinone synthase
MKLVNKLKNDVKNHSILKHDWLIKREDNMTLPDLKYWLSQEYFVSVDFVNWFLLTASSISDIHSKIILVQNIWEELGEGTVEKSHVMILTRFLRDIHFDFANLIILDETRLYLNEMKKIILSDPYCALGALGPANEYLLKLEYKKIFNAYEKLKTLENLPEASFFKINLEADQSHSALLFSLIERITETEEDSEKVIEGNLKALDARIRFYDGLTRVSG